MIIRRIVKDKEGNVEATLMLTPDQAAWLINMGLISCVAAGTAQIQDMTREEFEATVKKEQAEAAEGDGGVPEPLEFVDPKPTLQ